MTKLDYIFCLPGHPSSAAQAMHTDGAIMHFRDADKRVICYRTQSSDVFNVRNACLGQNGFYAAQEPYQGKWEYDRLIWIDSDNLVTADQIERLISHDKDIVAGWYRIYDSGEVSDDNKVACGYHDWAKGMIRPFTVGEMMQMAQAGELIDVDYSGFGLMVVKYGVFESLDFPWFRSWVQSFFNISKHITDDLGFGYRAQEKGYRIYVDPRVRVMHEKKVLL